MRGAAAVALLTLAAAGCGQGPPEPVAIDTRNDACSSCRMAISDASFAAQLVAAGEEPKLFDDVGCLRDYLRGGARIPPGTIAYVTDHRTHAWTRAGRAVYARVAAIPTPMSSGLLAWSDEASRKADPDARGALPLSAREALGADPPGGTP